MSNLKNYLCLVIVLFFILANSEPAGAVTRYDQDVTCYTAASGVKPSQPGYSYVLGTTAASQLSVRGNTASPPKIPYGTRVSFSYPVYVPGYGNMSSLTIRDTGDSTWQHTSYFVDVYYGVKTASRDMSCWNDFGTKTRNISY